MYPMEATCLKKDSFATLREANLKAVGPTEDLAKTPLHQLKEDPLTSNTACTLETIPDPGKDAEYLS